MFQEFLGFAGIVLVLFGIVVNDAKAHSRNKNTTEGLGFVLVGSISIIVAAI